MSRGPAKRMNAVAALASRPAGAKPSVCFVAHNAYPVMARHREIAFAGGAEVQQCLIARELANRGHRVTMICTDFGQTEGEEIDGVRQLRMYAPDAGIPLLRFVHPRLTSLWAAMTRADADVYYHRTRGMTIAIVAAFCRLHRRSSVYAAAHDADFNVGPAELRHWRDRVLFRWGVRRVDRIVVQSERQLEMCRQRYRRDPSVIRSGYAHRGRPSTHAGHILWVATAKPYKRPHLFLQLAARLPEYRFRLVGGPGNGTEERRYFDDLVAQSRQLANVEMTGFVPYADVEQHFDGAAIFVNTSIGEGFPNTFLQAWSRGVPTVSFFDPKSTIDGHPVGRVVRSIDEMALTVAELKRAEDTWRAEGRIARAAVEQRHSLHSVGEAYERLLKDLVPCEARA